MTKKNLKLIFSILSLLISLVLFYQASKSVPQNTIPPKNSPTLQDVKSVSIVSTAAVIASSVPIGFIQAQVTRVVDGDTIDTQINGSPRSADGAGQKFTVRFIGIDTPETVDPRRPVGCFGKEASDENKKLLTGKIVLLEKDVTETDKYDRLLRYIYLPQPGGNLLFVNDYLVREGYAKSSTYPPDVKYQSRFLEAEQEAQQNNRGLWSKCKN